jgi:hypothetical protein
MNKEQELAFPFISNGACQDHQVCEGGMTLRDYFAAKAMQAFIAIDDSDNRKIARWSYNLADAMINHRDNGDE